MVFSSVFVVSKTLRLRVPPADDLGTVIRLAGRDQRQPTKGSYLLMARKPSAANRDGYSVPAVAGLASASVTRGAPQAHV